MEAIATIQTPREWIRAVRQDLVWLERSERTRISVRGPDRSKLLQNLTTQDVLSIPAGAGAEAFVTNPQGKTIGYVSILAGESDLLVRADEGAAETLAAHFQKYGVFDDARVEDLSPNTFELSCFGPRAKDFFSKVAEDLPNETEYSHVDAPMFGGSVLIARESPAGFAGFCLIGSIAERERFMKRFREAIDAFGGREIGREIFDALRIEAGTPVFGRDVTAANLPQEIGRDDRTLNFKKGCYLGQETVARLDALGHVNKILKRGRIVDSLDVPAVGATLEANGRPVGAVTSAAFSEPAAAPVFLAFVKTSAIADDAEWTIHLGNRRVKAILIDAERSGATV